MDDSHKTRTRQPHGLGHRDEAEGAGGSPSDHDTWLGGQWQGRVCRERESKLDYWWLLCNRKSLISNFLLQNTHRTIQNYHWEHLNWAKEAVKRLKTIQIKDDICIIMGIVTELSPRQYPGMRQSVMWVMYGSESERKSPNRQRGHSFAGVSHCEFYWLFGGLWGTLGDFGTFWYCVSIFWEKLGQLIWLSHLLTTTWSCY